MANASPEDTLSHLTRLTQKPGVQSTLILSRTDGTVIRTSGLLSAEESLASESTHPADTAPPPPSSPPSAKSNGTHTRARSSTGPGRPGSSGGRSGLKNAEDVARVVWDLFSRTGSAVEQLMDEEDEIKLLRLRTKKNELVVVPGEHNLQDAFSTEESAAKGYYCSALIIMN